MSEYRGRKPRKKRPLKPGGYETREDYRRDNYSVKQIYTVYGKDYITFTSAPITTRDNSIYSWYGQRKPKDQFGWEPVNLLDLQKKEITGSINNMVSGGTVNGTYKIVRTGAAMQNVVPILRTGTAGLISPQLLTSSERLAGMATLKAYAKANAPDIDGAVQLAELEESLAMLLKFHKMSKKKTDWYLKKAGSLKRQLKNSAKGFGDPKTHADLQSAAWLRYRYGLTPMALSIKDVLEFLWKGAKQRKKYSHLEMQGDVQSDIIGPFTAVYGRLWMKREVTSIVKGACTVYPSNQRDRNAEPDFGFKPWDLISAGWERTPYSFVADWFVGVGDWISAYRPGGAEIAHQSTTRIVEVSEKFTLHKVEPISSNYWMDIEFDAITVKNLYIVRDNAITRPVLPALESGHLIWERKADSVALLYKLLGKRKKV